MADDAGQEGPAPGDEGLRAEAHGGGHRREAPRGVRLPAEDIEPQSWTQYEEVEIPSATLLSVVAEAAGVTERELIDLNPELRRACTPPRPYALKIPVELGRGVRRDAGRRCSRSSA